jgi:hypothetical protein
MSVHLETVFRYTAANADCLRCTAVAISLSAVARAGKLVGEGNLLPVAAVREHLPPQRGNDWESTNCGDG